MNRDAVVYAHVGLVKRTETSKWADAHVGLFKQDVQLAVHNQIGISKRVVVDQIIQL